MIPTPALVRYWKLSEGTGQVLADWSTGSPSTRKNLFASDLIGPAVVPSAYSWWYTSGGMVVTANHAADPDGALAATRLQLPGATNGTLYHSPNTSYTLPAGDYTMSLWVKSNTGSPQAFRMSHDNTATLSPDLLVTTGWTQVSYTFTLSAPTQPTLNIVAQNVAGSALDILVCRAQLEVGASPTAYVVDGSLVRGRINAAEATTEPAWASAGLQFREAGKIAAGQVGHLELSQGSLYVVAKGDGTASPSNSSWVSEHYPAARFSFVQALAPMQRFGRWGSASMVSSGSSTNDPDWRVYGLHYDGTTLRMTVDGDDVDRATSAGGLAIIETIRLGNIVDLPYRGDIAGVALYSANHTTAEALAVVAALKSDLSPRGVTLNAKLPVFVGDDGDSITYDTSVAGEDHYCWKAKNLAAPRWHGKNFGTSGAGVSTLAARAATLDSYLVAGRTNILHLGIGTNDLNSDSAEVFFANLKAYCLARRAAGWRIVLRAVPPRSVVGFNAKKDQANALIAADTSFYDVFYSLPTWMADDAAPSGTTYYYDGTHLTTAGHQLLGPAAYAAIAQAVALGPIVEPAPSASEIATAVRTELSVELARIDAAVSSRLAPAVSGRTLAVDASGRAASNVSAWEGDDVPFATAAELAGVVRDVSNASPAPGSLGAAVNAGAEGAGGSGASTPAGTWSRAGSQLLNGSTWWFYRHDDYSAAADNRKTHLAEGFPTFPENSLKFLVRQEREAANAIEVACASATPDAEGNQLITIGDITRDQLEALDINRRHFGRIVCRYSTHERTVAEGSVHLKDTPRPNA